MPDCIRLYFKSLPDGVLVGKCEFTNKYKRIIEKDDQKFSMKEYLYDVIKLVKVEKEVSLNFWLRNLEVYIREQSSIFNQRALEGELKRTIPHLVGC